MGCCTPAKQPVKTSNTTNNTTINNNTFKQVKTTINPPETLQPSTNTFNNKYNTGELRKTEVPLKNVPQKVYTNTKVQTVPGQQGQRVSYSEPYVAPPSLIQKPGQVKINESEQGYPDMTNYGNASNNYRNAAGRQADNVLRDEEFGYYAANGRNVSLRVDMNH